jgi:hypothetical protein
VNGVVTVSAKQAQVVEGVVLMIVVPSTGNRESARRPMEAKPDRPSIVQIVWLDSWAGGALLILIISWATLAYTIATTDPVSAPGLVQFTLYAVLIATATSVLILVWRIRFYRKLFSAGIQVRGVIVANFDYLQHAGRYLLRRIQVEFVYTYQGRPYRRRADITKGWIAALQPGREVEVIVDPSNPKRAFIKQVYL